MLHTSKSTNVSLTQPQRNVHVRTTDAKRQTYLLMTDMHWDNPKCRLDLVKRDLDEARRRGARVLVNGDTFCLMQGAYDPRKNKNDIRPEHNKANYIDAVVDTAVTFFLPYADLFDFFGYGNHETAIIKRLETDPLQRFVDKLNLAAGTKIQLGGYGGYHVTQMMAGTSQVSYKINYYHGTGGGGPVTKGIIQHSRMMMMVQDADALWSGHVHESYEQVSYVNRLGNDYQVQLREVLNIRTPTYKEEYADGFMGWHIERGGQPKPLGGRWLDLERRRDRTPGGLGMHIVASTTKTT